jgi:hypothetical protein
MSEEIKIGKKVLSEDDLKFTVQYNGEIFTLRYPTPFEKAAIEAEIVRRLGGFNRASYPPDHLQMVEATAYVDQLVIPKESPDWFKSAWTCYDESCIAELYRGYLQFRSEFQVRIRGSGPERGSKGSKP